jgi:3' terminal RNA ribose 2'-O-methyltransferase Hen1
VQLTITTTHRPATDLGYLLHKNPARLQSFPASFGLVHVFYPEATAERCTVALLLDVDPIGLVRRGQGKENSGFALEQYVNDRPYVASSFLSVAIADVFGTALAGRSKERPELAETPIPLETTLVVVPCRDGQEFLCRLFEPLGYAVDVAAHQLDPRFPEWGDSPYYTLTLRATTRLRDLLAHLYVLTPVLDDDKHYSVGDAEVAKLLRHGEGWLATHPERDLIAIRYLKHRRSLVDAALDRLAEPDALDPDATGEARAREEAAVERPLNLHAQRLAAVTDALKRSGAARVLDLGCGQGLLLERLLKDAAFEQIVGLDVSYRTLERARERLHLDRLPERRRGRITLLHGSLTYRDSRLTGYDAAAVVEVIEHLDPPRLAAFERALFEFARPATIVMTTPNREYNVRFERLPAGTFRHRDHRFEWTRAEFGGWAEAVCARHGYAVQFAPIGPEDPDLGAPSQMGVFSRGGSP